MNVFMNIESLVGPRAGIGYYTQHLISELMDNHKEIALHGILKGRVIAPDNLGDFLDESSMLDCNGEQQSSSMKAFKSLVRSLPGSYWGREKLRSHQLRKAHAQIPHGLYHEPSFIPIMEGRPNVITVHDLSHLRFPEHHPSERVRFLKSELPKALEKADHIITVSDFTKSELCHFYPEAEGKTTAIPLGVDNCFRPRSWQETTPVLLSMGLMHGTYILAASTKEPRKNLAGLVQTYMRLPLYIRKQTPLVIVGGSGWKSKALQSALSEARSSEGSVFVTGRVSRYTLANLMSGARLFAYPSFYEGFGLPIAEARASGVPVLTSNRGAMKEVAEDEAILVDPDDFLEPLQAFLEIASYEVSPFRFEWSETAKKTAAIYRYLA